MQHRVALAGLAATSLTYAAEMKSPWQGGQGDGGDPTLPGQSRRLQPAEVGVLEDRRSANLQPAEALAEFSPAAVDRPTFSRRRIWIEAAKQRWGSFAELNAWLGQRCKALWDEVRHPEHDQFSVAEMLEHERAHLMPMPTPFDGYVEKPARVSSTSLVSVARNRYSVTASATRPSSDAWPPAAGRPSVFPGRGGPWCRQRAGGGLADPRCRGAVGSRRARAPS